MKYPWMNCWDAKNNFQTPPIGGTGLKIGITIAVWEYIPCGYFILEVEKVTLTGKQKRFVSEYLIDLNATQAAIRAGYSARTANEQGARLLANVNIQNTVQTAMEKRQARTELTQDEVVAELRGVAFAMAADYSDSGLKVSNKLKALELLGRHLGMFTDKVEQTGGLAIKIDLSDKMKGLAE